MKKRTLKDYQAELDHLKSEVELANGMVYAFEGILKTHPDEKWSTAFILNRLKDILYGNSELGFL